MNTKFLLFLGCALVLMAVIRGQEEEPTAEGLNLKATNANNTAIGLNSTAASDYAAANDAFEQAEQAVEKCDKKADAKKDDPKGPLIEAQEALTEAKTAWDQVISQTKDASDNAKLAQEEFGKWESADADTKAAQVMAIKPFADAADAAKGIVVSQAEIVADKKKAIIETHLPKVYALCPPATTTTSPTTSPTTTTKKPTPAPSNNGSTTTPGATLNGSTTTPGANLNGSTTTLAGNGSSNSSDRADSYGGEAITANKWLMLCSTAALFALANFAF